MEKRKKKLINARFQLPVMLIVSLLSIFMLLVIAGFIGYKNYDNNQKISESFKYLQKAIDTENNIVQAFIEVARVNSRNRNLRLAVTNVKKDHAESMDVLKEIGPYLKDLTEQNRLILFVVLGMCCLQLLLVMNYMLRFSHRIAGPVCVMKKMIQQMQKHKKVEVRPLRKNDQLKDLHDELLKLETVLSKEK